MDSTNKTEASDSDDGTDGTEEDGDQTRGRC